MGCIGAIHLFTACIDAGRNRVAMLWHDLGTIEFQPKIDGKRRDFLNSLLGDDIGVPGAARNVLESDNYNIAGHEGNLIRAYDASAQGIK